LNIDIENYSHIIWDWNGTLLNDVKLCADIMNELLIMESLPEISVERYRNIFTFPVEEYYRRAGHNFKNNSFEILGKEFMNRYETGKTNCSLSPGAIELLEEFSRRNIQQHILSAYEQSSLNNIVKQFRIGKYFKHVLGLDNIYANGKMLLAEKLIKIINHDGKEQKILMIGDTLHDLQVALHIKTDCILIAHGHQSKERLEESNVIIFDDLISMMQSINKQGIQD